MATPSLRRWSRFVAPLFVLVPGCSSGFDSTEGTLQAAAVPASSPDVEAIGDRYLDNEPMFEQAGWCKAGTRCVSADANADRRIDAIRLDDDGVYGPKGGVWVAFGDGWGFGDPRLMGVCKPEVERCTLADVNGDGVPELVGVRPHEGAIYFTGLSEKWQSMKPALWLKGRCFEGTRCQLADVNADGRADLVELNEQGGAVVVENFGKKKGFGDPRYLDVSACESGTCRLADVDGDRAAELVTIDPEGAKVGLVELSGKSFGESRFWFQSQCGDQAICELADVTGDGASELIVRHADGFATAHLWDVTLQGEAPVLELKLPTCKSGELCWWADATADGRADFWRRTLAGDLMVYANRDLLDRLEHDAFQLSILARDRSRTIAKEYETGLFSDLHDELGFPHEWDEQFGIGGAVWPATMSTVSESEYSARGSRIIDRVSSNIAQVFAELPAETALTDVVQQRRWQRAMGRVISARTSMYTGGIGATRRATGERCGNAVIHDEWRAEDGLRSAPSYIGRYYDALRLPEQAQRVEAAAGALTAVWEGFRCLSQEELGILEGALTEAVVVTMSDLLDRGHPVLARRMWDRSLPLALLFFEATQHFTVPQTWRLLQVRIESGAAPSPDL